MKKVFYSILLILLTSLAQCQELVANFPITLKSNKEVFQLSSKKHENFSLVFADENEISVLKFSQDFNLIDSITSQLPEKKYKTIVGFTETENAKQIFWSKKNGREIARQNLDFKNKSNQFQVYNLELKNEIKIFEFSENNQFVLATIRNKSSILTFYIFDNLGNKTEKIVDLTSTKFYNSSYIPTTLFELFEEVVFTTENPFTAQKISSESQVSLLAATNKRKLYIEDSTLYLTFDNSYFKTQLICINLLDFTYKKTDYTQPIIREGNFTNIKSNSFFFQKNIYQLRVTTDFMVVVIKNLEGTIIKELKISKDDEIDFKNSDLIQIGTEFGSSLRTLNTKQFLRKVSSLNPSISCYELNNKTLITIGSISEEHPNNVMMGGFFGATGALLSYMVTKPIVNNFNSYADRKVVYFTVLLDVNNNPNSEKIGNTAFDKMENYIKNIKNYSSTTAFKIDENYFLGFYDTKEKEYKILKFQD